MTSRTNGFSPALAVTLAVLSTFLVPAAVAGVFVYPARGQDAGQQEKDRYECHQWATGQTGIDPLQMALDGSQTSHGSGAADADLVDAGARGAARGAIRGEIAGDVARDAAMGAALSPAVALLRHRRKIERQHAALERQIADEKAGLARYDQAWATCLRGRGYTVSGA